MIVDPMDSGDFQEDPMNVEDLPTSPIEDATVQVGDVEDQLGDSTEHTRDPEEALLRGEGVHQEE